MMDTSDMEDQEEEEMEYNSAVDNNDIDGDNEDQMSKRGYMSLWS